MTLLARNYDEIINGGKCKKCRILFQGHPLPKGQFCQLSPVSFDKLEKQKALHKDKDRVRNATEEARAKARDRNGTFYQILPWGKIAPGFLVVHISGLIVHSGSNSTYLV